MAAGSFLNRVYFAFTQLEAHITRALIGKAPPPDAFCLAAINHNHNHAPPGAPFSIKDLIGKGFLWAVPKHRRTVEKRLKRKFGVPGLHYKLLLPKNTLRVCNTCGDDHEVGVLCPTCYKKVIDETKLMQDKIQEELKLDPVDKEVVVLYDGEKDDKPDEFWQGKRVVEMKKQRPSWYSKNLMQQTTQAPAETSDVKPSNLG